MTYTRAEESEMSKITEAFKVIQTAQHLFKSPDMANRNLNKGCQLIKEFKTIGAKNELRQIVDEKIKLKRELAEARELLEEVKELIEYDEHSACTKMAIEQFLERTK